MALVDLIRKRDARTASAISATPATTASFQSVGPVARVATVAIADGRKARTVDLTPMLSSETEGLLAWLKEIGESDPAVIADVLRDCHRDFSTRMFFLDLAAEATKYSVRSATDLQHRRESS